MASGRAVWDDVALTSWPLWTPWSTLTEVGGRKYLQVVLLTYPSPNLKDATLTLREPLKGVHGEQWKCHGYGSSHNILFNLNKSAHLHGFFLQ